MGSTSASSAATPEVLRTGTHRHGSLRLAAAAARAHLRTFGFAIRLMPMFPSRPIDWLTRAPVVETVRYETKEGPVTTELYRPPGRGPHPAVALCLGVVPFGVDHPQIPRLKEALAHLGFVALIHWSPAMRDRRLVPEDTARVAAAYDYLVRRPRRRRDKERAVRDLRRRVLRVARSSRAGHSRSRCFRRRVRALLLALDLRPV